MSLIVRITATISLLYTCRCILLLGWWLVQTQDGEEQGWVPGSYLDPLYTDLDPDDTLDTLPSVPEQYISTSDYVETERDELSVPRGAVVDVITKTMDGWWTCR